jgi:hypothetical protein
MAPRWAGYRPGAARQTSSGDRIICAALIARCTPIPFSGYYRRMMHPNPTSRADSGTDDERRCSSVFLELSK